MHHLETVSDPIILNSETSSETEVNYNAYKVFWLNILQALICGVGRDRTNTLLVVYRIQGFKIENIW